VAFLKWYNLAKFNVYKPVRILEGKNTSVPCKMGEDGEESIQLPSHVLASVSRRHCIEMHLTA